MRLPRLTMRQLMAIVAVAALVLAAYAGIERRRSRFHRLSREHWEQAGANSVAGTVGGRTILRPSASPYKRRLAHYHTTLAYKYSNAARHPWWTVSPDPPPPER